MQDRRGAGVPGQIIGVGARKDVRLVEPVESADVQTYTADLYFGRLCQQLPEPKK